MHFGTTVVHALGTMLRTAVHRVLRAVTGVAVRAAAGRVMTVCVWTGLAVMGHRAMMTRATMVLRTVLRAMHLRGVSLWAVLRVLTMLAVRRMLSVLGMLTGCVRVLGALRTILATARLVLSTNLAGSRFLLGTFRATAVAVTMRRVRAFVRVGFVHVGRRTMAIRARAGVVRHIAVVIAVAVVAGFMVAVSRLVRLLIVRTSIAFGTLVAFRALSGIGLSERGALHAGASEAGAYRRSARSAGHHAAQFANFFRADDLFDLFVDLLHFFHVRRAGVAVAIVKLHEQLVQLLGLFRADELFHPRMHFAATRFHRGGHVGTAVRTTRFFFASFFATRLFVARFVLSDLRQARLFLTRLFFASVRLARFFFSCFLAPRFVFARGVLTRFVGESDFLHGFTLGSVDLSGDAFRGRVILLGHGNLLGVGVLFRRGVFGVCGGDISAKQCRQ